MSKKSTKKKMNVLLDYDSFNNKINEYKDRSNKNSEVINSKNLFKENNSDIKNEKEEIKINNSLDNNKIIEENKNDEKKSEKSSDEDDGTLFGKNTLKLFDELDKNRQQNINNDNDNILGFLNANNNDSDNIMNYLLVDNNKGKNNVNNNNLNQSDSDSD